MTDYTISFKLSNETVYACYRGRFWRWDGSIWKESHLMTQKFERAKAADKKLTPQAFLTNGAEFAPLDEYEIDCAMLDALENAKPCKNAPIEPVEEEPECAPAQNADAAVTTAENAVPTATAATPTTSESGADASASTPATSLQNCESVPAALADGSSAPLLSMTGGAPQDKPLTFIQKDKCPEFDYSGLPEQTVATLHLAENGYLHGKKLAEKGLVYMGDNIALAHDELCGVVAQCDNSKHGNRGEDSFRAWCLHIGITKDSAYRLLQVSALLADSSPRQQAILESLPPTLLYAVAKPSAPAELVEQVKSGDITTHKQYQEALAQIKAEKERADAAETREEEARKAAHEYHEKYEEAAAMRATLLDQQGVYIADIDGLKKQNVKLQQSYHDADESRIAANLQRQKAEAERDRAEARAKDAENQLSGSRQVAEAAKLRADKLQEENAALKKQPIAAVVDEEEVDRRAKALAHQWDEEELDRLAAEKALGLADARNSELAKDNTALRKQLATLQARANDNTQADFETANYCASLFRSAWDTCKGSYSRLTGEDLESTFQTLCGALNSIMEEASLLCRQPADYDGGAADEPDV